jgi:hypothetical protein
MPVIVIASPRVPLIGTSGHRAAKARSVRTPDPNPLPQIPYLKRPFSRHFSDPL